MKTQKEPNTLKKEYEATNMNKAELSEDELSLVNGGAGQGIVLDHTPLDDDNINCFTTYLSWSTGRTRDCRKCDLYDNCTNTSKLPIVRQNHSPLPDSDVDLIIIK